MKKLTLCAIILSLIMPGFLIVNAQEQPIMAVTLGHGACAELTVENHRTEACDAEIAAYPLPELEIPVEYHEARDLEAHPRGVLLPEDATPFPVAWQKRAWYFSDAPGTYPAEDD